MIIIGISGRKQSGKNTLGSYLVTRFSLQEYAFADALKNACCEIFDLTDEQLWGHDKEVVDPYWGVSPRHIMQTVGSAFRNLSKTNPEFSNVWIRSLEKKIMACSSSHGNGYGSVHGYGYGKSKGIIITDVRYNDEADFVKKHGGIIIRIERKDIALDLHESETQHIDADFVLENNGTVEELYNKAEALLTQLLQDK